MEYKELQKVMSALNRKDKNGVSRLAVLILTAKKLRDTLSSSEEFDRKVFSSEADYRQVQKAFYCDKILSLIFG